MPKIEAGTAGNFLLNGIPYQKGKYELYVSGDIVGLARVAKDVEYIAAPVLFSSWTDATDTPYVSLAALITDLSTFFFSTGGGGAGTGWDGEVATFALLPPVGDHTGEVYLVTTKTGSQLTFNLKRSGFYRSDGATWSKVSEVQIMFNDSELTFSDDADNTKQLGFQINQVSTSTRRTATWQDKNGTVAYLDDLKPAFNVNLDNAEASVNRSVGGGRTTFTVTHNQNTLDLKPEVFRVSDGRTVGWRVERTGVNTIEASRNGNVANGLFRVVI